MSRLCDRSCTLNTSQGSLHIPRGTTVLIPFYGVQHNPVYYPDPDEFRPERFSDDAVTQRPQGTFLTFGMGPKICVGELFSKIEISLGLIALLSKFKFSLSSKTSGNLQFDPKSAMLLKVKGGIHLNVEKL